MDFEKLIEQVSIYYTPKTFGLWRPIEVEIGFIENFELKNKIS
jgi:hypothetical protein|tara:strand:+ start:54 stop:182 length:129 start_codon:yes stop_codon:yes gene_type:complete